ncbi:MAG: peptidylprolyl isomerase [Zetaproteobacteria bacterium]|nr:MAG: peptidylprolyl isomerase [Zetaproteobacteria bacterium]
MQIANNKVVSIHYTLKNDAGEVLDSSEGEAPLAYLHGARNIIPGLERALEGKKVGDTLETTIEAADAYGEINQDMIKVVPLSLFQGVDKVEPGMQFQAETPDGTQIITVAAVNGDQVTIDGNHPLAGERLHFTVEVTDIRDATEEELAHGHVHAEGGCH